jgi:hypothetical protein
MLAAGRSASPARKGLRAPAAAIGRLPGEPQSPPPWRPRFPAGRGAGAARANPRAGDSANSPQRAAAPYSRDRRRRAAIEGPNAVMARLRTLRGAHTPRIRHQGLYLDLSRGDEDLVRHVNHLPQAIERSAGAPDASATAPPGPALAANDADAAGRLLPASHIRGASTGASAAGFPAPPGSRQRSGRRTCSPRACIHRHATGGPRRRAGLSRRGTRAGTATVLKGWNASWRGRRHDRKRARVGDPAGGARR